MSGRNDFFPRHTCVQNESVKHVSYEVLYYCKHHKLIFSLLHTYNRCHFQMYYFYFHVIDCV